MTAPNEKPKRRRRWTLESFPPEMLEVLLRGALEEVRLEFETAQLATRFQQRIHTLRSILKEEGHESWKQAYRARTSRPASGGGSILIISPHDSEFLPTLRRAGIETLPVGDDLLDDILGKLKDEKS
jgi:hypothetical protein